METGSWAKRPQYASRCTRHRCCCQKGIGFEDRNTYFPSGRFPWIGTVASFVRGGSYVVRIKAPPGIAENAGSSTDVGYTAKRIVASSPRI